MDKEILLFLCLIWSPNFRKIVKIEHLPLRAAILVSNVPRRRAPFFSRRNRAKTAKKCAKKCDARTTLLFCLLNLLFFFGRSCCRRVVGSYSPYCLIFIELRASVTQLSWPPFWPNQLSVSYVNGAPRFVRKCMKC